MRVAADGHEFRIGLLRVHGLETGLEQLIGSIDAACFALLLEGIEGLLLVG